MFITNYIRDLIHISLELAEYTKKPFLFFGNPGIAKTTNVESWAERKGYEVVELIGSQETPEEVTGYQVKIDDKNSPDGVRLANLPPYWYNNIMNNSKQGKKTLLFLDELSTATEIVQGALLKLIFGRSVGGVYKLPDDTLIVAAANYKGNLPPMNSIMSPTLNRFILVNVEPQSSLNYAVEFLSTYEERTKDLVKVTPQNLSWDEYEKKISDKLVSMFENVFTSYDPVKNKESNINLCSKNYDDIYESDGAVYNFITGRTMGYLKQLTFALLDLNLVKEDYKEYVENFLFGLIGRGSNNFIDSEAQVKYLSVISKHYMGILASFSHELGLQESSTEGFVDNLEEAIDDWIMSVEAQSYTKNSYIPILNTIQRDFPVRIDLYKNIITTLSDTGKFLPFVNKFVKVIEMKKVMDSISAYKKKEKEPLDIVYDCYISYYNQVKTSILNNPKLFKGKKGA